MMDVPVKVRSDFVAFACAESMALGTARLEELSTSLSVTLWKSYEDSFLHIFHVAYRERKASLLRNLTKNGK
jgi:hypothetical protein